MEPRLAYHTAPTPVETSTPPNREYIGKEPIRYIPSTIKIQCLLRMIYRLLTFKYIGI